MNSDDDPCYGLDFEQRLKLWSEEVDLRYRIQLAVCVCDAHPGSECEASVACPLCDGPPLAS